MYHFYLRHNNDVDNIAPIIYRMRMERYGCKVFVYKEHAALKDDYRLKFLDHLHAKVEFVDDITPTLDGCSAAIFDHVKEFHIGTPIRVCKDKGIPTIGLPHGMHIYSDTINVRKRVREYSFFDHTVTCHGLGSARYCREWMDVHQTIVPPHNLPETPLTKVCWIQNTVEGHNNHDEIKYMLEHLPFTVQNCMFLYSPSRRYPAKSWPKGWYVTTDEATGCHTQVASQAIDWADVILTTTSCTTADSLVRGKPTIHMSWLHNRKVSYEDYLACPTADSFWSLVFKLVFEKFEGPTVYTQRWIKDYVYAGNGLDYDVLGGYVNFITNKGL